MIALVAIPMIFFPYHYYDKPHEEPAKVLNIDDSQDI